MKKSLEAELMGLAEKILQMKNRADVHELKSEAAVLYEKLSVLSFAEKHFEGAQPAIGTKHVEDALAERTEKIQVDKVTAAGNAEKDENYYAPDGTQYNPEGITEPNTEKIKDIVAQMPPEQEGIDEGLEELRSKKSVEAEDDIRNIGVHYDDLPQFEPVDKNPKQKPTNHGNSESEAIIAPDKPTPSIDNTSEGKPTSNSVSEREEKSETPLFEPKSETKNNPAFHKKSLNDRLKKGISFDLNERLVYVKHLFDGSVPDYDRVLSQLNTFHSFEGAQKFIETVVKPDYNNWDGEEQYERRFMTAIKNKLN